MPAFIRYPFFGCIILALSACGGSGSSRLLELETPTRDPTDMDDGTGDVIREAFSSVEYLITDIRDARDKFPGGSGLMQVYRDAGGNEYLLTPDNVANMNLDNVNLPMGVDTTPAFEDLLAVYEDADGNEYLLTPDNVANMNLDGVEPPMGVTEEPAFATLKIFRKGDDAGARKLSRNPTTLNILRNAIVAFSSRYLSTGAVLAHTADDDERPAATCEDRGATGPAKCVFDMDSLREATTFHLGSASSGRNQVSFRDFRAGREPVMGYREVLMSQVRTLDTGESGLMQVYRDADGNEYLLTNDEVANRDLGSVVLPTGVDTAPAFEDLLAVYEDADGNEYLLTLDNVANMNLDDVSLPMGVTEVMFADLTRVREGESIGYEYVGYDGMLRYGMFFVGVYRFFDDEDTLEHLRFENASLGQIYDENLLQSGIQSPSVELTGEGVMVGMERRKSNLEHHLVQGDVEIMYDPLAGADDTVNPPVSGMPMIDIDITNVQRLTDDREAWYESTHLSSALSWSGVPVVGSKFEFTPDNDNPLTPDPGKLSGSIYGVEDDPEVGGVFHHEDVSYEIIGSFGSKLAPPLPPPGDDEDMMTPMP